MYWLILYHLAGGAVVIPEKYSDLAACQNAGMKTEPAVRFSCVPAPDIQYTTKAAPQFSGYFCGQNPDKCDLSKVYCSDGFKPKMHGMSIFCEMN